MNTKDAILILYTASAMNSSGTLAIISSDLRHRHKSIHDHQMQHIYIHMDVWHLGIMRAVVFVCMFCPPKKSLRKPPDRFCVFVQVSACCASPGPSDNEATCAMLITNSVDSHASPATICGYVAIHVFVPRAYQRRMNSYVNEAYRRCMCELMCVSTGSLGSCPKMVYLR